MPTYYYTGSATTEDYWSESGEEHSTYVVRTYGLADTIYIGYGTMDIDAGDGNDSVRFYSRGVAHLGNGDDYGSIGAQRGDSTLYGDGGDDNLFIYTYAATGSLFAYGGIGSDYFSTGVGGTAFLDGGSGFDIIGSVSSSSGNLILGKTLVSIEAQTGGSSNDLITPWGTDAMTVGGTFGAAFLELSIPSVINVLQGGGGADTVQGSTGNDVLVGNSFSGLDTAIARHRGSAGNPFEIANGDDGASDSLIGDQGNDFLVGGYGGDSLNGGAGIDTAAYVERYHGDGGIAVDLAAGYASDGDTLTAIENVIGVWQADDTLLGNSKRNVFFGLSGDDALDGRTGTDLLDGGDGNDHLVDGDGGDTLRGGDGDDSYTVSVASTRIVETTDGYYGGGQDTVYADVTWRLGGSLENLSLIFKDDQEGNQLDGNHNGFGNALNNTLNGNRGNNLLDGMGGTDTLLGGSGNDIYVVDNAADKVFETTSTTSTTDTGGIDTVQSSVSYTLGSFVENLTLTGTSAINGMGNGLANRLAGNGAANVLTGGAGNDTYLVGAGDTVIEAAAEGTDTVYASVSYTLGAGQAVETLRANAGATGLTLTGNELANTLIGNKGVDTLKGMAGTDTLNGGVGADRLEGGADNDVYLVDSTLDTVIEVAAEGTDTVYASVSYTLGTGQAVEALRANAGATGLTLVGNEVANKVVGGAGADTLKGMGSVDYLSGRAGADTFVLGNLTADRDTIADFSLTDDTLQISAALFGGGLAQGALNPDWFVVNETGVAVDANDRFIYNSTTGYLYFDNNGSAAGGSAMIAAFTGKPALTVNDFWIAA